MARGATPAKQVAGFIGKFDPAVARTIRTSRAALRKRYPTAVELVYDNYNALAMGWGGTGRGYTVIKSISAKQRPRRAARPSRPSRA